MRVTGVDGTKAGWVAITLRDGTFEQAALLVHDTDFRELGDVTVVGIDVPIGFGPRVADRVARRYLTGAASTVFTAPPRAVLETPFRAGLGVSAQCHAIGPRILHVTALAPHDPRLYEVHPEVSFRVMNDGAPLRYRKKSGGGALERIALLARHGIVIDSPGDAATAPIDDILDAGAAAWSAQRIATGTARAFPTPPELIDGLPIAIWA